MKKRLFRYGKNIYFVLQLVIFLIPCLTLTNPRLLSALPEIANVENGQVEIDDSVDNSLTITASDDAIINYNSFNLGTGEQIIFIQPSSAAKLLNRVVGLDSSDILGSLSANGVIFLINPNGISFGSSSSVDTAGLVASTHNISSQDFLAHSYVFEKELQTAASIVNKGTLRAVDGGYQIFVSDSIRNEGIMVANLGTVALATGDKTTLTIGQDNLISIVINEPTRQKLEGVTTAISNSGRLQADSGKVLIETRAVKELFQTAVNSEGVIQANTISVDEATGEIILLADEKVRLQGEIKADKIVIGDPQQLIPEDVLIDGGTLEAGSGGITVLANNDLSTSADIKSISGDIMLFADYDGDQTGEFSQLAGIIQTEAEGDIYIDGSGTMTLGRLSTGLGSIKIGTQRAPSAISGTPYYIHTQGDFEIIQKYDAEDTKVVETQRGDVLRYNKTGSLKLEASNGAINDLTSTAIEADSLSLIGNSFLVNTSVSTLSLYKNAGDLCIEDLKSYDGLITLEGEDIKVTYLQSTNLTLQTDNRVNTNPGVIIQANQVKVTAKQFGTLETPLNIEANLTYIRRTQGNIEIMESSGIGTSIMLRGPPDGFGAIVYNKETNLTLEAQSGSILTAEGTTISSDTLTLNAKNEIYLRGSIIVPETCYLFSSGNVTNAGLIQFKVLREKSYHFTTTGTLSGGVAYIDDIDGGGSYGGTITADINESGDITVTSAIVLGNISTTTGTLFTFTAGNDGSGAFISQGFSLNSYASKFCKLTLNVADNSTLGVIGTATLNYLGNLSLGRSAGSNTPTFTMGGAIGLGGSTTKANLTIGANTILSAGSYGITVSGDWTNNGTFTAGSGTVTLSASAATITPGGTGTGKAFNNLTLNASGSTKTLAGAIDIDGNFTLTAGTLNAAGYAMSVAGAWSNSGTFTHGNNTVTFDGGSANISSGGTTTGKIFYGITIDSSGTKTLTAAINIDGTFTITNGTFNAAGYAMSVAGNWSNSGTFTHGSNTVTFDGTTTITSSTASFYSVTISSTYSLTGPSSGTIYVAGNWSRSGTFTHNNCTVEFNGTANQTITGTNTWYNVTVNNSGASNYYIIPSAAQTIANLLTVNDGEWCYRNGDDYAAVTINTNGSLGPAVASTATFYVSGDWTNNGVFDAEYAQVVFDGGSATITPGGTGTNKCFGGVTISNTSGAKVLAGAMDIDGTFTISSNATLNAAGYAMYIRYTWSNSGTFTHGNNTVYFDAPSGATWNQSIAGSNTFYNLYANHAGSVGYQTVYPTSALIVQGTLTVNDGAWAYYTGDQYNSVTINSGGAMWPYATGATTFYVAGNWTNNGTFYPSDYNYTTTIVFNDSSKTSTISGNTTFYNFTCTTQDKTLSFASGSTQTISATWTITGASGHNIILSRSGGSGTEQWNVNPTGTRNISYATVSNSNNQSGTITPTSSANGGNNTGWSFPGVTINGTSNVSSGTVYIAVNSTYQSGETGTISSGIWSINLDSLTSGAIVTLWINGASASDRTTAVAKYDGSGDMTGLVLDALTLSIGSGDNQSLTVTNLGQYDRDNNTDILHTANSSVLTANAGGSTATLSILSGNTLTIGASETLTATNVTISGTLTSGGASTHNISGNWTNSGTFTYSTSTVNFNGSAAQTITGATTWYNLYINNSAGSPSDSVDVDPDGAQTVTNLLTVNDGQWTPYTGDTYKSVTINSGGIMKPDSGATIYVSGDWTKTGTFTANSSTVSFNGSAAQVISAATTWYNLYINNSYASPGDSYDVDPAAAQTVANLLTVNDGQWQPCTGDDYNSVTINSGGIMKPDSGATIYVSGTWSNSGTFTHNNSTVVFDGTSTQTLTSGGSSFYNLTVNGSGGKWSAGDNLTVGNNLTVQAGTLDMLGAALSVGNTATIDSTSSSTATLTYAGRKTFYDTVNSKYWAFYYTGSAIEYAYSSDGSTWTTSSTLSYSTTNFSVTYKAISSTGYTFLVTEANPYDIVLRRGTLAATSISFESEQTVFDGTSGSDYYLRPNVTLDANNYVWVASIRYNSTNQYEPCQAYVRRSTNVATGDLSAWQAAATVGRKMYSINSLVILPRTSSNMYLLANTSTNNIIGYAYNGSTWSEANTGGDLSWFTYPGIVSYSSGIVSVQTVAIDSNNNVYIGGLFDSVGGVSAVNVAKWDGSTWSALGSGLGIWTDTNDGVVMVLAFDSSGNLYAGGYFTKTGDEATTVNYIAKWNGSAWSALGTTGVSADVWAMAWDSTNSLLYVGGNFVYANWTGATGTTVNGVAKWNPSNSTWSALGATPGMNNIVYALALDSSNNLYAGGSFTTAGGTSASGIAKWNGSSWSALGTGTNATVASLAFDSTNNLLYAGGYFTTAGGTSANRIAKWNGSSWSALGSGMGSGGTNGNGGVRTLVLDSSNNLYAGGYFVSAGGNTAYGVAKWDGSSWSSLGGEGTYNPDNYPVDDLALDSNGILWIVGDFTQLATSGYYSTCLAKYGYAVAGSVDSGTEISAVSDSSGNIHLLYTNSSDQLIHKSYNNSTSTWGSATTVSSSTCSSPSLSINSAGSSLFGFWISSNVIYGKSAAVSASTATWDASALTIYSTNTNTYLNSCYYTTSDNKAVLSWVNYYIGYNVYSATVQKPALTLTYSGSGTISGGSIEATGSDVKISATGSFTQSAGEIRTTTAGNITIDAGGSVSLKTVTSAGSITIGGTTVPTSIIGTSTNLSAGGTVSLTTSGSIGRLGIPIYISSASSLTTSATSGGTHIKLGTVSGGANMTITDFTDNGNGTGSITINNGGTSTTINYMYTTSLTIETNSGSIYYTDASDYLKATNFKLIAGGSGGIGASDHYFLANVDYAWITHGANSVYVKFADATTVSRCDGAGNVYLETVSGSLTIGTITSSGAVSLISAASILNDNSTLTKITAAAESIFRANSGTVGTPSSALDLYIATGVRLNIYASTNISGRSANLVDTNTLALSDLYYISGSATYIYLDDQQKTP